MKAKKKILALNEYDYHILITALVEWKNRLLAEGRFTDAIDEAIEKLYCAKTVR